MLPPLPLTRRDLLATAGTGLGLLGLALLSEETRAAVSPLAPKRPHFPARAKRVIHLFMNGGPSQVDTFDPKPALDKWDGKKPPAAGLKTERGTRGLMKSPFKFTKHGKSGIEVSDLFPQVAKHADKLCVVRSMHTNVPNHEPSLLMMNSGETQPTRPSMGSWLLYGLGAENQNLPGFMVLCPGKPVVGPQLWSSSFLPGVYQGTHLSAGKIDPRTAMPHLGNPGMGLKAQREQLDLLKRMNELHLAKRGGRDSALEARIASLEMAFRMQTEAQDAFDLSRESKRVREGYGPGYFAEACLLARRLVERGVRMVQLYTGAGQPWDDHGNILDHRAKARQVDQPIAALLADLAARGLLEDTLVLWGGEFGRTPTSEGAKGRDHNNHGFTVWLAGGGTKAGTVVGASDEFGFAAAENKVHVHDLHATILHLMGIDHEKLTYRYGGRDFRLTDVHGRVVKEMLA
ncbi:MAG: DUF1501 domain-containing protein [Gemmataceae bacterium]|nr:DUF1501 domain-containing protein [Gemmataceae bacterium]